MLGRGFARHVVLAAIVTGLTIPSVAQAAFPGVNGKIAFSRDSGGLSLVDAVALSRSEGIGERQTIGSNPPQIFTMDPSGGGQTNVSNGTLADESPNWSPDGKLITLARADSQTEQKKVWVMNPDGSNKRQVTDGTTDQQPAFAADGTHIYFVRSLSIWVVNLDGTNAHPVFTAPTGHSYSAPAASPDGTRIAFADSSPAGVFITIGNADGSGTPQAIPNQGSMVIDVSPDWSPDSSRIVFSRDLEVSAQLFVIGADGSNPHSLTDAALGTFDIEPHFSPDGQQVTFARETGLEIVFITDAERQQLSLQAHIWAIPSGGGTARQLTTDTTKFDFDPAWQPQPRLASIAQVPACTQSGAVQVAVSDDSGFKSRPSAVHFQIDGGAEQSTPTAGDPGTATITVAPGTHSLTFWGEDAAGYQEADHHTISVQVDNTAPTLSVTIDQHRTVFRRGQKVTTTTVAKDAGSGLAVNPSRRHVRRSTARVGTHTVRATAVDLCGNRRTRSIRYRVVAPARKHKRARFTG
jgi:Tol biopolymer transport system component